MTSTKTKRKPIPPPAIVIDQLGNFFRRNGYVRWQNETRLSEEGHWVYKKGQEVRLCADSAEELAVIRKLLRRAGFKPGQPFTKGRQYRQPLYGMREVDRFLELIGAKVAKPSGDRVEIPEP